MNGTSVLLGGGYPWRSGDPATELRGSATTRSPVVANERDGLSLATLAAGPLGLRAADDSLGRLTLPRGVATDGTDLLILSHDGTRVYRYDPVRATLVTLPEIGAQGLDDDAPDAAFLEPRRFRGATNIAASRGALFVCDPAAHRVQVFDIASLALIRVHDELNEPVDVVAGADGIFILDRAAGRVYSGAITSDSLTRLIDLPAYRGKWDRIAVDKDGRVYVRNTTVSPVALDVFEKTSTGELVKLPQSITDSAQVRDKFTAPLIDTDSQGGFALRDAVADPCGLRRPAGAHIRRWHVGDRIFAFNIKTGVLVVHLLDGRVRHRFGPYDAAGSILLPGAPESWAPNDVIVVSGCVLILDERHQIVYSHRPGAEGLQRRFAGQPDAERRWRRLADDGTGCLLLWDAVGEIVDRVDQRGRPLGTTEARKVAPLFKRTAEEDRVDIESPLLTRKGPLPRPTKSGPTVPVLKYAREGSWISQWLDSDVYDCQWHVIELSISRLAPGSRVVVKTRTSNDAQSDAEVAATIAGASAAGSWRTAPQLSGPTQPNDKESGPQSIDLLVLSGPGQFIQLMIEMAGTGIETVVIGSVRVRFPRESLLQYLPAVFSSPEEQREFLDRYLSIMQATWLGIERSVDTFERFLDPDSVPDAALAYLASWLDLSLEGTWQPEENRRLLQVLPNVWSKWGTLEGMRAWLRVYLAKLGGVTQAQLEEAGIPGIVERFADRRRLMLSQSSAALCSGGELWSPAVERRFQVGAFAREGEIELVSTGDPELDVFQHYAHAFRVFVPAGFVRNPAEEALLRRAIDMQKPAHTTYELVLVEPQFRIGDQSTIGLDVVLGEALGGTLVCPAVDDAPSRQPYQSLAFDTVLGCGGNACSIDSLQRSLD